MSPKTQYVIGCYYLTSQQISTNPEIEAWTFFFDVELCHFQELAWLVFWHTLFLEVCVSTRGEVGGRVFETVWCTNEQMKRVNSKINDILKILTRCVILVFRFWFSALKTMENDSAYWKNRIHEGLCYFMIVSSIILFNNLECKYVVITDKYIINEGGIPFWPVKTIDVFCIFW